MRIKRGKTLADSLRTLPLNEWVTIKEQDFKTNSVKNTITRLRKEGVRLISNQRGCIGCIKVQRQGL